MSTAVSFLTALHVTWMGLAQKFEADNKAGSFYVDRHNGDTWICIGMRRGGRHFGAKIKSHHLVCSEDPVSMMRDAMKAELAKPLEPDDE